MHSSRLVSLIATAVVLVPSGSLAQQQPDLGPAAAVVREAVELELALGAVVMVTRGDEVLLHEAFGHKDVAREQPMQKDTLFRMASNTKAVTAAAVLTLVADGELDLDDPISRWFPTFAAGDGARITIRHLLTHSSGLRIGTLFVEPLMAKSDEHPEAPNLVLECARFGEIGPKVEPGTSYSYSNPGYNLLAGLVEVVSGEGFADYCARRFYRPLRMTDSCHHETVADNARMAMVVQRREGRFHVRWRPGGAPTVPFVRGSGGMISTASDFAKFARLFLNGGRCGERQVLTEAMVELATHDQIPHLSARYGFGWIVDDDGFSHGGSDGTWMFCDRRRDLVGILFTQTQNRELGSVRERFRRQVTAAVPVAARRR